MQYLVSVRRELVAWLWMCVWCRVTISVLWLLLQWRSWNAEKIRTSKGDYWIKKWFSSIASLFFLRRSCTSGYKHETFRLCSSNLSCKYFLVSHRIFFPFSRWLTEISRWLPNSYVKQSLKWQKGTCRYKHETLIKMFISMSNLNIYP